MKKVVVVSPHPDDETLGCGGTLLKHRDQNDGIYWIIMTDVSESIGYTQDFIRKRREEIQKIADCYKMKEIYELSFPAAGLDNIPLKNIIENVSKIFKEVRPEIIYLPYRNDIHTDHRVTFDAVISCTKSFRYPSIKKVLMYETLSETEFSPPLNTGMFQPNCFSDISDYMDKKIEIMNVYESEIGEHPFPRSERNMKALATYRGAIIGVDYAEAFMTIKEVF